MIDHYRKLFDVYQWLEDALCWIVVRPLGKEVTGDDLLRRLNGGRDPLRRTMAYPREDAFDEDQPVLFAFEGEGGWGYLEFCHGFAPPDHILAELSTDAQVWMTTWHVKGEYTILYAAHGEIRSRIRSFVAEHRVQEGDPDVLAGFLPMLDGLDPEDYRGRRSAAFAFVEASTGMRLDGDQVDVVDAPVIVIDNWYES